MPSNCLVTDTVTLAPYIIDLGCQPKFLNIGAKLIEYVAIKLLDIISNICRKNNPFYEQYQKWTAIKKMKLLF